MDPALLNLLCCPETRQPLHPASPEELRLVSSRLSGIVGALVRADGEIAYPIRDGIPQLVAGEQIRLH